MQKEGKISGLIPIVPIVYRDEKVQIQVSDLLAFLFSFLRHPTMFEIRDLLVPE